ncbi:iron transporter FTH1 [Russula decolorans]
MLREGLEAVVFVGGVSLGQSADSIPIAAIVGIICGLLCGFVIYAFASRAALTVFLVIMTNFILIIGAGLFSKSVGSFEKNAFNHLIGGDTDSTGDGPDGDGWLIFGALTGWTNSATSKLFSTSSATYFTQLALCYPMSSTAVVDRHHHAGGPQVARGLPASIWV